MKKRMVISIDHAVGDHVFIADEKSHTVFSAVIIDIILSGVSKNAPASPDQIIYKVNKNLSGETIKVGGHLIFCTLAEAEAKMNAIVDLEFDFLIDELKMKVIKKYSDQKMTGRLSKNNQLRLAAIIDALVAE